MNVGMSNLPPSRIKDFFATPALSLTLAGVFRGVVTASEAEVEEGEAESVGRKDPVDISSENTGPGDDDAEDFAEEDEDDDDSKRKKKRRKKYHRHTMEQIREMEALFKESPHPDENQRQELSKRLGLAPRQVKFWFQNRRTQIKAIQERHENSLLKTEMEKLHEENQKMIQTIKKSHCPNCGFATSTRDSIMTTEEQQLRIENARLKAEIEKLRGTSGRIFRRNASPNSSCSEGNDQENMSCLDSYTGILGLEKHKIMESVNHALEELKQMAFLREPLWVKSVESGREMLNYDEYMRQFCPENSSNNSVRRSIEASRDTGNLFLDINRLIQAFMDVNKWKEMFPGMISRASTVDVICNGESDNKDGTIQLMFAEIQMMTPLVPTREVYFVRHCKKLNPETWAIVDVSIDTMEQRINASLAKCRKRPSGCIIEDKSNGHCKVTWVEHMEWHRSIVHTIYRSIVNGGMAFEARRWIATLQVQCERIIFFMATNVPTKDSNGVTTLAGRKSLLRLAQRMSSNFCLSIAASSCHSWTKLSSRGGGEDIRMTSRKNLNDPGEPVGLILCAVSSVWLPISPTALFDFLKDDKKRSEWDIMSTGVTTQIIANIAKGQDRGNSVTIHATKSKDSNLWIIQDSCTNAYESVIVYAPADINRMQSVLTGCDSGSIPILSSGFAILPDKLEARSMITSSRREEKEQGCILTVAFQILANASPTAKLTAESLETVNTLISCTLQNIKVSFQCEDGT